MLTPAPLVGSALKDSAKLAFRLAFLALAPLTPVCAQSLLEMYQLALQSDPTFASAAANYRATTERLPQAQAALRPTLNWVTELGLEQTRQRSWLKDQLNENADKTVSTSTTTNGSRNDTQTESLLSNSSTTTSCDPAAAGCFPSSTTTTVQSDQTTDTTQALQTTSSSNTTERGTASTYTDGIEYGRTLTRRRSASTALMANWTLYRPALSEQVRQARLLIEQAEFQLNQVRQDLALRVVQAFLDYVLAQENKDVIQAQRRMLEEQLRAAEFAFDSGNGTILEKMDAKARVDLALADESFALNDFESKKASLQTIIGAPLTRIARLKAQDFDLRIQPEGVDHWTARAETDNILVKAKIKALEVAQKEQDKQSAAFKPSVDLSAKLGLSHSSESLSSNTNGTYATQAGSNTDTTGQGSTSRTTNTNTSSSASTTTGTSSVFGAVTADSTVASTTNGSNSSTSQSQLSTSNQSSQAIQSATQQAASKEDNSKTNLRDINASILLRVNVPLYDGGLVDSRVRQAMALVDAATYDLNAEKQKANLSAQRALYDALGNLKKAIATKTALQSSQLALEATTTAHNYGLKVNLDILNAQQQVSQAQRDLNRSRIDALLGFTRLQAAVGRLEPEVLRLIQGYFN